MRLIDADALERDYRSQFEAVYKNIRDTVLPSDFYIEREAAYHKELVRSEMEAFFEYLESRPTIDAEPVRHGDWIPQDNTRTKFMCSDCKGRNHDGSGKYCSECGCKMDA
jgi:hypothetical protein